MGAARDYDDGAAQRGRDAEYPNATGLRPAAQVAPQCIPFILVCAADSRAYP